jgi:hypothetical protein
MGGCGKGTADFEGKVASVNLNRMHIGVVDSCFDIHKAQRTSGRKRKATRTSRL